MSVYIPFKLYPNNTLPQTFNSNDFETQSGAVTKKDLLSYANLYTFNIFYQANTFLSDLYFSTSLNNISTTVFNYLSNVSSDIQEQFNNLYSRLTNYYYDNTTSTQSIVNNLGVGGNIGCLKINANQINAQSGRVLDLESNDIKTKTIQTNFLYTSNGVGCFIYNNGFTYPIIKSGSISTLPNINTNLPIYISIAPKYSFTLLANGYILGSLTNTSSYDYIHLHQFNNLNYVPTDFLLNLNIN